MENELEATTACGVTFVYKLEGCEETVRLKAIRVAGAHNKAGSLDENTYTVPCGFRETEGLGKYFVPPCLQSISERARSKLAQKRIVPQIEGTCLKSNGREREV